MSGSNHHPRRVPSEDASRLRGPLLIANAVSSSIVLFEVGILSVVSVTPVGGSPVRLGLLRRVLVPDAVVSDHVHARVCVLDDAPVGVKRDIHEPL